MLSENIIMMCSNLESSSAHEKDEHVDSLFSSENYYNNFTPITAFDILTSTPAATDFTLPHRIHSSPKPLQNLAGGTESNEYRLDAAFNGQNRSDILKSAKHNRLEDSKMRNSPFELDTSLFPITSQQIWSPESAERDQSCTQFSPDYDTNFINSNFQKAQNVDGNASFNREIIDPLDTRVVDHWNNQEFCASEPAIEGKFVAQNNCPPQVDSQANLQGFDPSKNNRPDPSILFKPLLEMGFSPRQCCAAIHAMREVPSTPKPLFARSENFDTSSFIPEEFRSVSCYHLSRKYTDNCEPPSAPDIVQFVLDSVEETENSSIDDSSSALLPVPSNSSSSVWLDSNHLSRDIKTRMELALPSSVAGFVFHCNSFTKGECLQRNIFACPSGGKFGVHSKVKRGDILFLADFASRSVLGIFEATCKAEMNIEKNAFGGRFPWQVRVRNINGEGQPPLSVHLDLVNSALGVPHGAKLNGLSTAQLHNLLLTPQFFPLVPKYLKKNVPPVADNKKITLLHSLSSSVERIDHDFAQIGKSVTNIASENKEAVEEHPAISLQRLHLINTFIEKMTSVVFELNSKHSGFSQDGRFSNNCSTRWPIMPQSLIRNGILNIFNKWLFHSQLYELRESDERSFDSICDPVLAVSSFKLLFVYVVKQFEQTCGNNDLCIPSTLLASCLTTVMFKEIEEIVSVTHDLKLFYIKRYGMKYDEALLDTNLGISIFSSEDNYFVTLSWTSNKEEINSRNIHVTQFRLLCKMYKENMTESDPSGKHMLTRIFVLLVRYDSLGGFMHEHQDSNLQHTFNTMIENFGISKECPSSFLSKLSSLPILLLDTNCWFGSIKNGTSTDGNL